MVLISSMEVQSLIYEKSNYNINNFLPLFNRTFAEPGYQFIA